MRKFAHAWFTRVGSQSYNVLTRISIFNWGWFAFSRTRRVHWLKAERNALLPIRPKSWEVKQRWQTVNFNKVIGQNIRSKLLLILGFNSFITLGQIGIWETLYTMIQFPERLLIIEPGLVLATVPATQQEEKGCVIDFKCSEKRQIQLCWEKHFTC